VAHPAKVTGPRGGKRSERGHSGPIGSRVDSAHNAKKKKSVRGGHKSKGMPKIAKQGKSGFGSADQKKNKEESTRKNSKRGMSKVASPPSIQRNVETRHVPAIRRSL